MTVEEKNLATETPSAGHDVSDASTVDASGRLKQALEGLARPHTLAVYVALLAILAVGAYFRFTGLDWDDTYHLHPDERFLTSVAASLRTTDPLTYLKTSESTLNPYNIGQTFYVYGNFPMTATRLAADLATSGFVGKFPLTVTRLVADVSVGGWSRFYIFGLVGLLLNFPLPAGPISGELVDLVGTIVDGPISQGWLTLLSDAAVEQDFLEIGQRFVFYDGIHLVGRALSSLVDLTSVLFTFLVGRRLYDWRVGLLGALLMAAAVMPIQQSHFFTMDNWAAGLSNVALYAAIRAGEDARGIRWWLLFGAAYGLAVASRINMAPLALMAGLAAIIWLVRQRRRKQDGAARQHLLSGRGFDLMLTAFVGVAVAGLTSIVVFRLAQPYAFSDAPVVRAAVLSETGQEPGALETAVRSIVGFNPQWRSNLDEISRLQSPDASFPPAIQWTSRAPILFPLVNFVFWGVGLAAGMATLVGFSWALWRAATGQRAWSSHLFLVTWAGGYFAFMGLRWVTSIRYFLPVYPALLLLAAWALVELWQEAGSRRVARIAAGSVTVAVVAATLLYANAFVDIYRQPVTRVAASAWMLENIPTGATLVYDIDGLTKESHLPLRQYTLVEGGTPLNLTFTMPENGRLLALRLNYVSDGDLAADGGESVKAILLDPADGRVLGESSVFAQLESEHSMLRLSFDGQGLVGERTYAFIVEAGPGGPVLADTTVVTSEHWDDALPVRYQGIDPYSTHYRGLSDGVMEITIPDSESKRQTLYRSLDEADYIVLSSQRALWSLPRIPLTYPLTIRYYEALFSGELGFELVAQFHRTLSIGPLNISDVAGRLSLEGPPDVGWPPPGPLAAEEAFSVYDHPPVWIFAKTEGYSSQVAQQVLGSVDLSQVITMTPGEASRAPNGLMQRPEVAQEQQLNGTYAETFSLDGLLSRFPWLAAVVWWLTIVLLGLLVTPLAFVAFPGLQDRGYPLARVLSLLLLSYPAWLLASLRLLPFTRSTLLLVLSVLAAFSLLLAYRKRRELVRFLRRNLGLILFVELLSVGLYLLFIGIRLGNPDVWDVIWGGEKPMDLSYFNAVLKSTYFPPYDPWYAGGYINYYYYGFVLVGSLTKLLGIVPTVAYNLIVSSLFSFTGVGAFSIAYNLVAHRRPAMQGRLSGLIAPVRSWRPALHRRAVIAGLVAAALIVLLGNLAQVTVVLNAWYRTGDADFGSGIGAVDALVRTADGALDLALTDRNAPIYTGDWFWTASRAIRVPPGEVQPITEFPFFTFLYGDLHAHMIALPLTLLALAWAISFGLRTTRRSGGERRRRWLSTAWIWFVGAAAIGVLRATNTWDFPTYLLVGMAAILLFNFRQEGRVSVVVLAKTGLQAGLLVLLSVLLFLPFALNYGVAYTSFSLWPGSYTTVGQYFLVHGLFLFLSGTYLAIEFRAWTRSWGEETLFGWRRLAWPILLALFAAVALMGLLLSQGYLVGPLALLMALLAGILLLRPRLSSSRRIVLFLLALSLALTLMVEIIVLDGDIGRMNTVFKFYLQVWVMLSIVGGVAAIGAWRSVSSRRMAGRVWRLALVLLVAAAALYPVLATRAKWAVRMSDEAPITLDGMAFMQSTSYGETAFDGTGQTIHLGHDYEAIRWMWRNIPGSPVIAEAHGLNPYRSAANRVAMYTGLPAIVGWDWHQRQQRAVLPGWLVSGRIDDLNRLYNTTEIQEAMAILSKYDVGYVYAGQLEWVYYNPQGLLKFQDMADMGLLREVYRNSGVSIYEVLQS